MKTPSKNFYLEFSFKINIFRFFRFFKKTFFQKNIFLHDEIIFFVRIFFCDQVCISSNPRNHLEHLACPHGDSEPPARTQFLTKISQIPPHNYMHPPELSIVVVQIWGCLSSNRSISELKWSWMSKRLLWDTNKCPYSRSSWFLELQKHSKHDF